MQRYALTLVLGVTLAIVASIAAMARQGARTTTSASGLASPSSLMGTVRDAGGKPLNGVPVSARATDQTFTTSVYTDDKGEYVFPTLPPGDYKVWAQAVGYSMTSVDVPLGGSHATVQAFALKPLANFESQLTGVEWYDSLPDDTADHRRMKQILYVACTDCHSLAVILQNQFDEAGWRAIITAMESSVYNGYRGRSDFRDDELFFEGQIIRHHKNELAKYLTEMRGPGTSPMTLKPQSRPTGDAARVVVTEYDFPIGERPSELAWYNGSDWSQGPSTGMHGVAGLHDVMADAAGNVWVSESRTSFETDRSLTKLDPKTGQVTAFKLADANGGIIRVEQVGFDPEGNLWMHSGTSIIRLNPETETFTMFNQPRAMGGMNNSTDSDSKGRIWANGRYGAVRFDPVTEKWQLFQQLTPGNGITYGITADAEDNGWWSEFYGDKIAKKDMKTGEVREIDIHDPGYDARKKLATAADLDFYDSIGSETWGSSSADPAPYADAPRRLAADKNGSTVWVPLWAASYLAEINIHTLKVTYHQLPIHGHPYKTTVDKQHNAWASVPLGDSMVKFNSATQQWTEYMLPSHGCGSRHISFDDLRNEAWLPCDQSSKVGRFQFRTAAQIQAQKAAAITGR